MSSASRAFISAPGDLDLRPLLDELRRRDIAFWNEGDPAGLRMFDHILLVERKNWTVSVGYPELAVFNDKLTSRGRPMGIFVAAAGITGEPAKLTAAHGVLARALAHGREIIVMTRQEIENLADTEELVLLLKRKRAQLAVSGTIFELEPDMRHASI